MSQNEKLSRYAGGSAGSMDSGTAEGNDIEKVVIQETVYYTLPAGKGRNCPFDYSVLTGKTITVWNSRKEVPQQMTVLECHRCGRHYLKDTVAENIRRSPLKIRREEVPYGVSQSSNGNSSNGDTEKRPGQCRWLGCRDRAFKNGLCWDHLQHDNNVT